MKMSIDKIREWHIVLAIWTIVTLIKGGWYSLVLAAAIALGSIIAMLLRLSRPKDGI
jgi:hypothetical protein